jgi:hypothetical protein
MHRNVTRPPSRDGAEQRRLVHAIRQQLLDKIRLRYDLSPEEAERRLRLLEREESVLRNHQP